MIRVISILILFSTLACDDRPKVITPVQNQLPAGQKAETSSTEQAHEAVVEEVQHTTKYTYLLLDEAGNKRWIAIAKAEVAPGEKIKYSGGVRMTQFKSAELDRVFDDILLVSNVQKAVAGGQNLFDQIKSGGGTVVKEKLVIAKGSVALSELFKSPEKYNGKKILVSGRCTKINYQIMGRNWIHLEDESGTGKTLTVTSATALEPGKVGTFEGTIALNKDFGAGYQYDIILEDAQLK